jgi:ABC-2 type transport system ATP-binding protein
MEIFDLSKIYKGQKVLDIKKLHIDEGRIYAVVGENGAGKTTLFRILAGLILQTNGTVEFSNVNERIGVMIETPAIELNMTAEENLRWVSKVYGKEKCQDIEKILELVKLNGDNKKVRTFSLGMKQRLGIAMSLIHNPNILILDEPMNGLDPLGMLELRNNLLEINKNGTTIILSSHILEEVYKLATDYIFIKNGQIIQVNRLEDMEKTEKYNYKILTSDDRKTMQILQEKFACEVQPENIGLIFSMKSDKIISLSKSLADEKVYIIELTKREFDIEAYYMEVIGT